MVEKTFAQLTVVFIFAAAVHGFSQEGPIQMDFAPIGPHLNGEPKILSDSDYDFMQRLICGIPTTNATLHKTGPYKSYVYFKFGVYGCKNNKFEFHYCLIGGKKVSLEEIKKRSFGSFRGIIDQHSKKLHFCETMTFLFIHSTLPDDPATIASHEKYMCQLQNKERIPVYSMYNYKLVSCRENKYHFEGCIFVTAYISRKSQFALHFNIPEHQRDVCFQLAIHLKIPIEEEEATNIYGIRAPDEFVTYELATPSKEFPLSEEQKKKFYESVVCGTQKMRFFFYDFGVYECINGELRLQHCFYGDNAEDPNKIKQMLMSQSGDYIHNTKDLRFCSQIISTFTVHDTSYGPENIWKQEDYMCEMVKKFRSNFSLPSGCDGSPYKATKHCQYLRQFYDEEIIRAGIFYNFKLMQCDSLSKKPFFTGCMYEKDFIGVDAIEEKLKKNAKSHIFEMPHLEYFKPICLLLSRTSETIKAIKHMAGVEDRLVPFDHFGIVRTNNDDCEIEVWPNATIPYYIDPKTTGEQRNYFYNAIQEYEKYTCLNFKRLATKNKEKYLHIAPKIFQKCKENTSDIFLRSDCSSYIMHSLGFQLGITNELFRTDREQWIASVVDQWNISKAFHEDEQMKEINSAPLYFCPRYSTDQPFDYLQPIYYDHRFIETKNPRFITLMKILNLKPRYGNKKLWSANGLTYCSVAKLNSLYGCDPKKYLTDCHGLNFDEIEPLKTKNLQK